MYSYKLISINVTNFINTDSHVMFNKLLTTSNFFAYDLFVATAATYLYHALVHFSPYFNEYFKHILNSAEAMESYFIHPELILAYKNYSNTYFSFCTDYFASYYVNHVDEAFTHPILTLIEIIILFTLLMYFAAAYFTYYNNSNEDNLVDHDYLVGTITVESEEEIASLDDTLLTGVIFTFLFFWFFWATGVLSFLFTNSYTMCLSLFPFLYMLIVIIPTNLLIDYGIYFLTYLSGSGKSTSVATEVTFDYIAFSIFYLRLLVQNVRLIFMVFTFTELHEMIIYNRVVINVCFFDDVILAYKGNYWNLFKNGHYVLFKFVLYAGHWAYELFHTFFMVIFQFIAFFAMIFWLFLFLYSMFSVEMQEAHFYLKRKYLEKKHDFRKKWRI